MKKKKGVKVPAARQLPSGSWFCRVRVNGDDISITRDTEKEAVAEAMAIKYGAKEAAKKKKERKKTLSDAIDEYIDSRRLKLSPSTIYSYERYKANRFQTMMCADVFTTTDEQWQEAIDTEAIGHSPKYITNVWSLLAASIKKATKRRPDVNLPAAETNERLFLDADQIEIFVEALAGESIEIPALLELSSLRRSEILALKWSDVDLEKSTIHIRGAKVCGDGGKLVHKKQNKTKASRRSVPIIPPLQDALEKAPRKGEYVVTLSGSWIYTRINKICEANGLPKVGNHGLRHSFASLAFHLGIPEKIAMEIGGWDDEGTMRKIYTHLAQKDIAKRSADFTNFFNKEKDNKPTNEDEVKASA